jgi:hypothetical protein
MTLEPTAMTSRPDCRTLSVEEFLDLETRLGLFDHVSGGVRIWEYVRLYVFLAVEQALGGGDAAPVEITSPWRRRLGQIGTSLAGLLRHNPYATDARPLCFFGFSRRLRDEEGVWWDPSIDPLLDSLDCPYYYIERTPRFAHPGPTRTRDVKHHDLLSLLAFGYRALTAWRDLSPDDRRLFATIESALFDQFGVRVDLARIARPILQTRQALVPLYRRLFERVKPRAVFFASINYPERTALEVARSLGIATVEVQHGVMGVRDLSYVFPRGVTPWHFPDHFLVWGSAWTEQVELPLPPERITAVGWPYLEGRRRAHAKTSRGNEVLVLSQPTVGAELARFAIDLARRPEFRGRVIYRLHPNEEGRADPYPGLRESGAILSGSRDGSIHALLARCGMQVGVYSAALVEGLAFGAPTYLVDLPGVENLRLLVDRGLATLVRSADEMPSAPARPEIDTSALFEPDGLARFRDAVARIVGAEATLAAA